MIVQGDFTPLIRKGLRDDFRDNYQEFPLEFTGFLRTGSMDMPEIKATIMTGMNRFFELGDGDPITFDNPVMGPVVAGVDREFGLGFSVSRKMMEDDQYGKANQASKWLGKAARLTQEYKAAQLLDDAFAGSIFKGIDGLALLSTAHTLINSTTTVANRPAADVGFSMTGVSALMDLAMNMKDENGDPMVSNLDTLILSNNTGDYNRALQIFGSEKEPFTTENQDNAIKKRLPKMKIEISHYKTSTKSYFMQDSKLNDAWFLTRRAVEMDDTFDFITKAALFTSTMRFLIWFVDWRGWYGTNPA